MMRRCGKQCLIRALQTGCLLAVGLLASSLVGRVAHAGSLAGYYYSVPNNSTQDPDFQRNYSGNGIDGFTVTGLVQSQLGPDGLPVVSTKGATWSGASGPITMVNSNGELLWWTPSAGNNSYGIQFLGTSTDSLPINNPDMYVSNFPNNFSNGNANDSQAFLTAIWRGTFSAGTTGTYTFNSGSDDDTWVFIDGSLVVDNGGIHGETDTTSDISLTAGTHSIDIFYADRHTTGAVFKLNSFDDPNGNPVNLSPPGPAATPEPASLTLLGLGGLGLAGYGWRRRRQNSAASQGA